MPDDIRCGCAGIGMEKCVKNVGDGEAVAAGAERKNGCSGYNVKRSLKAQKRSRHFS